MSPGAERAPLGCSALWEENADPSHACFPRGEVTSGRARARRLGARDAEGAGPNPPRTSLLPRSWEETAPRAAQPAEGTRRTKRGTPGAYDQPTQGPEAPSSLCSSSVPSAKQTNLRTVTSDVLSQGGCVWLSSLPSARPGSSTLGGCGRTAQRPDPGSWGHAPPFSPSSLWRGGQEPRVISAPGGNAPLGPETVGSEPEQPSRGGGGATSSWDPRLGSDVGLGPLCPLCCAAGQKVNAQKDPRLRRKQAGSRSVRRAMPAASPK